MKAKMNNHRANPNNSQLPEPKKKWGQNYLKNTEYVLRFLEALELDEADRVLEIGPGRGAISDYLIANSNYLLAIEVDPETVVFLQEKYAGFEEKFSLVEASVLDLNLVELAGEKDINKLAGALPYNISKQIVRQCCLNPELAQLEQFVFILQKEVARNYAGLDNKISYLNHLYLAYTDIEYVAEIEKSNFFPVPKVDSAIIKFTPKSEPELSWEELSDYEKFLHNTFRNPRKKIIKNLSAIYKNYNWTKIFTKLKFHEGVRAQELSHDQILKLYEKFKN